MSAYDPLPGVDADIRLLRYGSLAEALVADSHRVLFWTSTFAHWRKRARFAEDTLIEIRPNFTAQFLHAPGYARSLSLARIRHNRELAKAFTRRAAAVFPLPDLIVAEIPCLELAEAAARFAQERGIQFVCDIQDIWPDVYLTWLPPWIHGLGRLLLSSEYARLRRILAATQSVTAVSEAYLAWTTPWLRRPRGLLDQVYPLGYALPSTTVRIQAKAGRTSFLARHKIENDQLVVTFLGQLATSYDVETIVDAAYLLENNPNLPAYRLVIAGNGSKEGALCRRAARLRTLTFTGWLEPADAVCLLESSHIALAAYAATAAQSLPYKPFEYMAFGLPIINSLPGELAQIIDRHNLGLNYRAGSAISLAKAISCLLVDQKRRSACAEHARSLYTEAYSSAVIYSRMSRFLAAMAAEEPL